MSRSTRPGAVVVAVSLAIAGCSGGGGDDVATPDGAVTACGTAAGTISSYPGSFTGATVGAGNDLAVAEMACADERLWFGAAGDDQVVSLTGLRAGATYVVELATNDDLSFYVATGCDAGGPTMGSCLLHVDSSFTDELGDFVAPAGGSVVLIVDAFENPAPPRVGAYTVTVREAECRDSADCTDPGRPVCNDFACLQCATLLDCVDSAAPLCDTSGTCVAGPAQCTGDDANEPDDGPAAATMLAAPTIATPTVVVGAVCSLPAFVEMDWYRFTLATPGGIRVDLTYDTTDPQTDVDVFLADLGGGLIGRGENLEGIPEAFVVDLPAGSYYVLVNQFAPEDVAAAVAYSLTLSVPECLTSFDCLAPAQPVCNAIGECVAGPNLCTGDDAADAGTGDDGPAAATVMAGATQTFNRALCATTGEADWYRATMTLGEGLTIDTSFTVGEDFDVYAHDAAGNLLGFSYWQNPETVTLSYLPAGDVYIEIVRFAPAGAAASAYSTTLTRTATALCATRADCAAEYQTQLYRGQCTAGACIAIPPGTRPANAACDSLDDCMSGLCSYNLFEADAQRSVCTATCAQTAECGAVGPSLTCTTGFTTNLCVPSCASDLDCGARTASSMIDAGLPWNYNTCTVASGVCSP